jgi:hypothetical protein
LNEHKRMNGVPTERLLPGSERDFDGVKIVGIAGLQAGRHARERGVGAATRQQQHRQQRQKLFQIHAVNVPKKRGFVKLISNLERWAAFSNPRPHEFP